MPSLLDINGTKVEDFSVGETGNSQSFLVPEDEINLSLLDDIDELSNPHWLTVNRRIYLLFCLRVLLPNFSANLHEDVQYCVDQSEWAKLGAKNDIQQYEKLLRLKAVMPNHPAVQFIEELREGALQQYCKQIGEMDEYRQVVASARYFFQDSLAFPEAIRVVPDELLRFPMQRYYDELAGYHSRVLLAQDESDVAAFELDWSALYMMCKLFNPASVASMSTVKVCLYYRKLAEWYAEREDWVDYFNTLYRCYVIEAKELVLRPDGFVVVPNQPIGTDVPIPERSRFHAASSSLFDA